MDPLSITTAVVGLTAKCVSTCKTLHDLAEGFEDVPMVITAICSESKVISIALSELQMRILKRDDLSQAWASKSEIWEAFEVALTGCMCVFSCLETETRSLVSQNLRVWAKLKFMWNQDRLKELLGALRGQQTSIGFLLKVLEITAMSDMQKDIRNNRSSIRAFANQAQSLRSRTPSLATESRSIFDAETNKIGPSDMDATSVVAPSEIDFEFDHIVLNSTAYREAFVRAQSRNSQPQVQAVEGDLIDFGESIIGSSDTATIREVNQDLEGLDLESTQREQHLVGDLASSRGSVIGESTAGEKSRRKPRDNHGHKNDDRSVYAQETRYADEPAEEICGGPPQRLDPCPEMCSQCSQPIEGKFIDLRGRAWHLECFDIEAKSSDLLVPASSSSPQISDQDDSVNLKVIVDYAKHKSACFKCKGQLDNGYIQVVNRYYHANHFSCDECDTVFGPGSQYHEHDKGVYCNLHYYSHYASRCHSCKFPVSHMTVAEKQEATVRRWHVSCYFLTDTLGIVLPASPGTTEYLSSLDRGVVKSFEVQDQYFACLSGIFLGVSDFLSSFRGQLSAAARAEKPVEVLAHRDTAFALLHILFTAAIDATGRPIDDRHLVNVYYNFFKYLSATSPRHYKPSLSLSSGIKRHITGLGLCLMPMIKVAIESALEHASWNQAGGKLNTFLARLTVKGTPLFVLPHDQKWPKHGKLKSECSVCQDGRLGGTGIASGRNAHQCHPECWRCYTCGGLTEAMPLDRDVPPQPGRSKYIQKGCGCGGNVKLFPNWIQVLYILWGLGCEARVERDHAYFGIHVEN